MSLHKGHGGLKGAVRDVVKEYGKPVNCSIASRSLESFKCRTCCTFFLTNQEILFMIMQYRYYMISKVITKLDSQTGRMP